MKEFILVVSMLIVTLCGSLIVSGLTGADFLSGLFILILVSILLLPVLTYLLKINKDENSDEDSD